MFITARFIIGFAGMFSIVAAASLIGGTEIRSSTFVLLTKRCEELAHPKERPVVGCLFTGFYDLGNLEW